MKIEFNEKESEAFYRECINVQVQYRTLQKNPEAKIRDYFTIMNRYMVLLFVLAAILLFMGIMWGFSAAMIVALLFMAAVLVLVIRYLRNMNITLRNFLEGKRQSVFTMDENGISISKEGAHSVSFTWENTSFVRAFTEGICFAALSTSNMLIFLPIRCRDELFGYIRDNGINVKVIG